MSHKKSLLAAWGAMLFIVTLIACTAGLFMLKVLPPIDADRIMRRLPAPARQAVNTILFPHPDQLPTPAAPIVNVSSLLTPAPSPIPAISPSLIPSVSPSLYPSVEPTVTSVPPASVSIPTVRAPGPTQAARSTPASGDGIDVLLTKAKQEYQGWNNCGPATLAMNLSFFGWTGNQYDAAKFLKPDTEDKNVSPDQLAAYARSVGFQAQPRVNGTLDLILAHPVRRFDLIVGRWLAFCVALLGILAMMKPWDIQAGNTFLGMSFSLLAALFFSIYSIMGKKSIQFCYEIKIILL